MRATWSRLPVNTNPFAFEELATSLASLNAFFQDGQDLNAPIRQFTDLYTHALQEPPGYREITELAGQSTGAGDHLAGKAAWLLLNIAQLNVYGVYSRVWHKVGERYAAPIIDQIGRALKTESSLTDAELQALGTTSSLLSVLGVKEGRIWIVQTAWGASRLQSAVRRGSCHQGYLFGPEEDGAVRQQVFQDPFLDGKPLATLYAAYDVLRKAFPSATVEAFALFFHKTEPDFELYAVNPAGERTERLILEPGGVVDNSLNYVERLTEDAESLWILPSRLTNDSFRGLPPCRGSRSLMLLAATARRQMVETGLLLWREKELKKMIWQDHQYDVTRDKVRHDLVDRLLGQGYMKKCENRYYLMPRGIARYMYSLAKYTSVDSGDSMALLDQCTNQRNRIVNKFGYLI